MKKILVVDDEPTIVFAINKYLVTKGYDVHTATNGEMAVEKVREIKPHIVLLDIRMPGMNGIDALKEIKKADPDIGVIMVTSMFEEKVAKQAMDLGAYDYITKPFDLNYLETVVLVKIRQMLA